MKYHYVIFLIFIVNFTSAQNSINDYLEGKKTNCQTSNSEAKKYFKGGINLIRYDALSMPKYISSVEEAFARAALADKSFCDAYFFCGYTQRLQNKLKEAYSMFKMADSLSSSPSLLYKVNLAMTGLSLGGDIYPRRYFEEIVNYFPENPDGYYGIAITSPLIGDYSNGLVNINLAIQKANIKKENVTDNMNLIKAVLLTLNQKYEESLYYFEKVQTAYQADENFNIHYSLSLLKIAEANNDEIMKKKAKQYYDKIDKTHIPKPLEKLYSF